MKVVVILSGGMDSATLLYDIVDRGYEVEALSFNYGQRHYKELVSAIRLCHELNIRHKIADVSMVGKQLLGGSSQTSDNISVPHGHYEAENMKLTVVPNRNMVMISLAVGYALSINAEKVFYGAHSGDHFIYADCRFEFVEALNKAIQLCDDKKIELVAPYLKFDKGDIVILGKKLKVPYELTWTCYEGKPLACGKCGACQERLEAFKKAGMQDPIKYEEPI